MKRKQLLIELLTQIEEHGADHLLGINIDQKVGKAVITTDSEEFSNALQTIMKALGLDQYMQINHCEETAQYPEMECIEFDLNGIRIAQDGGKEAASSANGKGLKRRIHFDILQLPTTHPQCFRPLSRPLNIYNCADLSVHLADYKSVWGDWLAVDPDLPDIAICEQMFAQFNRDDRPNRNFSESRSMSVSDIIQMDEDKFYFCDSFGFVPLTASGKAMK